MKHWRTANDKSIGLRYSQNYYIKYQTRINYNLQSWKTIDTLYQQMQKITFVRVCNQGRHNKSPK